MAKTIYVTKAQSRAASAIVERSAASGRYVRPGVAKIAEASGQYITKSATKRHPRPTVTEKHAPPSDSADEAARRSDLGAIRDWARANGYQVSDRGRIDASIILDYDADAAH